MDSRMKAVVCFLLAIVAPCSLAASPCDDPTVQDLPFCDYKLDVVDRVKDLVSRMTTEDKISQIGYVAPGISHLNVPSYNWWSEALHGVATSPGVNFNGKIRNATSFPQIINMGATFNRTLFHAMGNCISTEARAMHNQGQAGLDFFAPNINIFRDPRWGRGQETPGEDPYLTSQYVVQYVSGMQYGNSSKYLKTAACCKHFAAYDLELWNGTDRFHFDAIVSDQDLMETYFPAFESCVREAKVASVMCSYNAVNGVPSCANGFFQNEVARQQWGFDGYIVSDCGAVQTIMDTHHYTNTTEETMKVALQAGTDLNCGSFYQKYGQDAYDKNFITDAELDLAVSRLFTIRIRLGMFDPTDLQPYWTLTPDQVNSKSHQMLALDAARESIVLLQNNQSTLPLKTDIKIGLIGPNLNASYNMEGNYYGVPPYLITPLSGIQNMGVSVEWALGCADVECANPDGFPDAISVAEHAEAVIMLMGLDQIQEREGHDRDVLTLPGLQLKLLQFVKAAILNKNVPFIVVLMSGGPVDISWAKSNAHGILWVGYPGQSGGQAIAEVLFGKFNPSGRLPVTYYPADYVNQISFFNMDMRAPPGRTYKFYTGTPVFPFGHGLSYSTFTYVWSELPRGSGRGNLSLSLSQLHSLQQVNYRVKVTNKGPMNGGVSVLAFIKQEFPNAPLKKLFDFQKVYLVAGESQDLFFALNADTFSSIDDKGQKFMEPGVYWIMIGDLRHLINLQ